jgi:hypothetical protein
MKLKDFLKNVDYKSRISVDFEHGNKIVHACKGIIDDIPVMYLEMKILHLRIHNNTLYVVVYS